MGWGASTECNIIGPDYFGFFASEVAEVLSQDEDFILTPDRVCEKRGKLYDGVKENSGCVSLFSDCFGTHLSDSKKERLKLLLRQGVVALSQEVDEMLDPVFATCQLQSILTYKESLLAVPGVASNFEQGHHSSKKLKMSPSSGSEEEDLNVSRSGDLCSNDFGSDVGAAPTYQNVPNDLQFLLQSDKSNVESAVKMQSNQLLATLGHMEEKLEELLNIVMSHCRLMTLTEKHNLRRRIRDLPPRHLDRVAEILCRIKQVEKHSCSEVHVDFEKEDKETLWRLYFYIEALDKAKGLCEVW